MNELAVRESGLIRNLDDAERAAQAMAASGYFQDAAKAAQAIVKILAGHEMGFGPFASMNGIHIIQGRPAVGANLMAAAVKRSGRYNYRVTEMSDTRCAITFYENGQPCGESVFTIEDARKAQTKNLDKFPRNMLFARAMSNGVRWYCPDVFAGSAVYVPEELGATVDGEGNVIDVVVTTPASPEPPASSASPAPAQGSHWIEDEETRRKFWAWASSRGLSRSDVHAALGVDSILHFGGDKRAAIEKITAWIAAQTTSATSVSTEPSLDPEPESVASEPEQVASEPEPAAAASEPQAMSKPVPATLAEARAEFSRVWNAANKLGLHPPLLDNKWSIEEIMMNVAILEVEISEATAASGASNE